MNGRLKNTAKKIPGVINIYQNIYKYDLLFAYRYKINKKMVE